MTSPVPVGSIRLYDQTTPVLPAGVYRITSSVEVTEAGSGAALDPPPADRTHLDVGGPRFRLGPAEVAAVHPAAGTSGAYADRLPHVVLGRHTLPWERRTPGGAPWLAVLVARKDTEVTLASGPLRATAGQPVYDLVNRVEPADPDEPVTVARFRDAATLRRLLPTPADIGLLAHVRQVNVADTALDLGDDDGWFAVVAGNRLPLDPAGTGTDYIAMLVSLEGRDDVFRLPATGAAPPLVVLTSWEFTSATGGTFEALARALDVAAFPAAPATLAHTDRSGATTPTTYHGPLTPGAGAELALPAAYELGRLLGTADGRFTREIVGWHRAVDAQARTAATRQLVADHLAAPLAVRAGAVPEESVPDGAGQRAPAGKLSERVAAALAGHLEFPEVRR